ncbi:AAA family ATPase, partial [candidate division WOR-3 bacterium]|nr:AAA family ATPase [candidate division WOR-3 bacterium]
MAKRKQSRLEKQLRVKPGELRWKCPPRCLKFRTTDDIKLPEAKPGGARDGIIGQSRAVDALALGLEIEATGYNIFVTGPVGTGRTTTVRQMLERYENEKRELDDKCYVNNFKDPDQPALLRFPAGRGQEFRRAMDGLVDFLVKTLPGHFEGEAYQRARAAIVEEFKERGGAQVREFEKKVA